MTTVEDDDNDYTPRPFEDLDGNIDWSAGIDETNREIWEWLDEDDEDAE